MSINWDQIRKKYQLPNEKTFFETPYFGAMSDETVATQIECLTSLQTQGNTIYYETVRKADEIRAKVLKLLHASNHQSALIGDVSSAMVHLAETLSDKKILLLEKDFPSVTAPWVGRKCDIVWIEPEGLDYPLEKIENKLKEGVDVLALSWVMYNSGLLMDLAAFSDLCQKYGVILIVDGTQGIGAHSLNLDEIKVDVFLASCYKWWLSGYGTGIAIARKEFEEQYEIKAAGHCSLMDGKDEVKDLNNHYSGVRRFELGHVKCQQIYSLHQSLLELESIGFENIQERTKSLNSYLYNQLKENNIEVLTPEPRSSNILMIEGGDDRVQKLREANIAFTNRHGMIRLGAYFYNNESDIERLIEALK